ncbi:MAG: hypothetical protein QOE70_5401 [Chthoniobacter sp.]|jgi:hypothetical protein|nr:hypothetical protein [Chthoniobacter sp.]
MAKTGDPAATTRVDEKAAPAPPELLDFYAIPLPPADDPSELLKHRFLCRGGGMLVVGSTGIGKSAFVIQCAILWSVGREAFGIKPRGALRVLIVQAENDQGDMAEFREGILAGIGLTIDERAQSVISTACVDSMTGTEFCRNALKPLLEQAKPDIVIVDPALAYLGGEANQQRDVSAFLRNGLNPLLHEYRCGLVLVHHTSKPPQGEQKASWTAGEFAYLGTGSAEWANWARAALVIRSLGSHDFFELRAAKRGKRLHWTDADFNKPVFTKIIAHSMTRICWREASKEEFSRGEAGESQTRAGRYKPPLDDFLTLFPASFDGDPRQALLSADQLKNAFHDRGWDKSFYKGMADEAECAGHVKATAAGRYNQILRGRPAAVEAYEARLKEKATIMEDVPLTVPAPRTKKRKRPQSS